MEVFIEHLLKNSVQFLDDFLLVLGRERLPDFAGGDFARHDSYSFTSKRNSSTAGQESVARGVSCPKSDRLVARRGKRSTMPSRYSTQRCPSWLRPPGRETNSKIRP
jgi:hypothetical protein